MVYYFFSTRMFVLNAAKEPGSFGGGGGGGVRANKSLRTGSQWVNASQIAFNIIISPTLCKIVESRRDL